MPTPHPRTLVIISGASRGIGRAIAIAFANSSKLRKLHLCLLARNTDGLSETANLVRSLNRNDDAATFSSSTSSDDVKDATNHDFFSKDIQVSTHQIDLSNLESLEEDIENIFLQVSPFSLYDHCILVNNAGSLGHLGRANDLPSPKELQKNIDLNVTSACWISSYFVRRATQVQTKEMDTEDKSDTLRRVTVVNVSSLCAISPFKTMAVYCSGKAYRDMFHNIMALEEESENSRANVVKVLNYAPGAVETEMTHKLGESEMLDADLKSFFREKDENAFVKVDNTSKKLVGLVLDGKFESGKHIDYWD